MPPASFGPPGHPPAPPLGRYGTPSVGKLTARLTGKDIGLEDVPDRFSAITFYVMTPHCHAPSCIREEFWNADTGELICNVTARSPPPPPPDPSSQSHSLAWVEVQAGMHQKGGGGAAAPPPPFQGAQPMSSHCPPDSKC